MLRTFIALKVEPEKGMSDCINHLKRELKSEKIRWVDPVNMHITLRFLGDTSPAQITSIIKTLKHVILQFNTPVLEFRGLDVFRNIHRPRVIWMGLEADPILSELKARIDRELIPLGFPAEEKEFRPHLTLGRMKFLKETSVLERILEEYHNILFQKNNMKEIIFYESILRQTGPEYLPLGIMAFKEVF